MSLETLKQHRIVLRQEVRIQETKKFEEAVSPGHILEASASSTDVMKKHSVAGGDVSGVFVAQIDYLQGNGVDDDYAEGDRGPVSFLRPGDKFVCILEDGTDYSDGDLLMSAGNGNLQSYTAQTEAQTSSTGAFYPNRIVARLLEDADLSTSSSADASKYARVEVV